VSGAARIDRAPCDARRNAWHEQKEWPMGLSEELEKLDELHGRGALTADEFARAKARVLDERRDSPASASPNPATALGQLRRSTSDRWLGGICGGIARATGSESWIWRLLFVLLFLFGGTGLFLYVLLWIFVPSE
jgi:phage shock protein PspC (stress-responsive transcriptional regulator)